MSDSEEDNPHSHLKIVVVGDSLSGKTSIVTRYVQDQFPKQYQQTIGLDFFHKRVVLPGDRYVALKIHDVGGASLGGSMLPSYLYGASGILFVYDITNQQSFDDLEEWLSDVAKMFKGNELPHFALVANKVDLEHMRIISHEKQKKFAEENEMSCHTVSARTGDCIQLCFQRIACRILGIRLPKSSQNPSVVKADVVRYDTAPPVATSRTSVCSLQ